MRIYNKFKNSINLARRSRFHYFRMAMLKPPYWLRVNGTTSRIFAGDELGSGSCYAEVVVEDCYDLFKCYKQSRPQVIVDVGANVGVFSKLCALFFPNADIYSYEPNPSALRWLEQNAKGTRIKVFPFAVGERSGEVNLDVSGDSTLSRVTQKGGLSVNCIAASEVADGRMIDLLKMDCEGSEWSILRDTTLLNRTRDLCLEFHLYDDHTLGELKSLIGQANHQLTSISNLKEGGKFGVLRSKLKAQ